MSTSYEYKPLYTMEEAAKILQVNRGAVDKLRKAGLIKCLKLGRWKVRAEELDRFLREAEGREINLRAISKDSSSRVEKAPR